MQPLGRILSKFQFKGPGPLQVQRVHAVLQDEWSKNEASQVRVASYRRGVLVLEVTSASLAFEWQAFRRQRLLERLKEEPELRDLRDVRIRVGSGRRHVSG